METRQLPAELAQAIAAGMPPCPNCAGRNVRSSQPIRFGDKVAAWLGYSPFRCRTCQHRFYKRAKADADAQPTGKAAAS